MTLSRLRSRLRRYGGSVIEIDGRPAVQLRDPNDNARHRYQYVMAGGWIWRRMLQHTGRPMDDGSPWEPCDVAAMSRLRGWHPIVDALIYLSCSDRGAVS